MFVTILQASVVPEQWKALSSAFEEETAKLSRGIVETFLLHSSTSPDTWQILTVWESRQALDELRATGETPRGILIFRAAKAEPVHSVFDVTTHTQRG
jgi:heme-degrading monooxygenase HmoA